MISLAAAAAAEGEVVGRQMVTVHSMKRAIEVKMDITEEMILCVKMIAIERKGSK